VFLNGFLFKKIPQLLFPCISIISKLQKNLKYSSKNKAGDIKNMLSLKLLLEPAQGEGTETRDIQFKTEVK
jgi:hypothetical protein